SLAVRRTDDTIHLMLGDFGHFIGAKHEVIGFLTLIGLYVILPQLFHVWDYTLGHRRPPYLKSFRMLAGLQSPKATLLTHHRDVYRLCRTARYLFLFMQPSILLCGFCGFLFTVIIVFHCHPGICYETPEQLFVWTAVWCTFTSLAGYIAANYYIYHTVYVFL